MKTSKAVLHILQNHYPERLFRACLIHPPWIFNAFYAVISPFIDAVTKAKICMLNKDDKIRSTLLALVDADVLEAAYGGTDSRPFDSTVYLREPFELDFHSQISGAAAGAVATHDDTHKGES
jgi:hypothetical protein